jgi:hypothetical protein
VARIGRVERAGLSRRGRWQIGSHHEAGVGNLDRVELHSSLALLPTLDHSDERALVLELELGELHPGPGRRSDHPAQERIDRVAHHGLGRHRIRLAREVDDEIEHGTTAGGSSIAMNAPPRPMSRVTWVRMVSAPSVRTSTARATV